MKARGSTLSVSVIAGVPVDRTIGRGASIALFAWFVACSGSTPAPAVDAGAADASIFPAPDASPDAADSSDASSPPDAAIVPCAIDGNPGTCIDVAACAARSGFTATAGHCPGAASIECCAPTPSVASNPPIPAGYRLMTQAEVTTDMTAWAVAILDDPATYPLFATATRTFGAIDVLARVEWHPPDFQNGVVHRGVTLYVPIGDGG